MKEGTIISAHPGIFNKLVTYLERIDKTISDEDKVILIMYGLPPSYHLLVTRNLYSRDTLKLNDVTSALVQYELQRWLKAEEGVEL